MTSLPILTRPTECSGCGLTEPTASARGVLGVPAPIRLEALGDGPFGGGPAVPAGPALPSHALGSCATEPRVGGDGVAVKLVVPELVPCMGTSGDPSPAYVSPLVVIAGRCAGGLGVSVTLGPGGAPRLRAPGADVAVPAGLALPGPMGMESKGLPA